MTDRFEPIITSMQEKIDAVDRDIVMGTAGVAQALDDLRKALADVDACLASRDFEKAADLGYSSVSSGFVFLQRTLGGLQDIYFGKSAIVSEVAMQANCSYEEALPHVDAIMPSAHPRKEEP